MALQLIAVCGLGKPAELSLLDIEHVRRVLVCVVAERCGVEAQQVEARILAVLHFQECFDRHFHRHVLQFVLKGETEVGIITGQRNPGAVKLVGAVHDDGIVRIVKRDGEVIILTVFTVRIVLTVAWNHRLRRFRAVATAHQHLIGILLGI